jgi:hypothetical protein
MGTLKNSVFSDLQSKSLTTSDAVTINSSSKKRRASIERIAAGSATIIPVFSMHLKTTPGPLPLLSRREECISCQIMGKISETDFCLDPNAANPS